MTIRPLLQPKNFPELTAHLQSVIGRGQSVTSRLYNRCQLATMLAQQPTVDLMKLNLILLFGALLYPPSVKAQSGRATYVPIDSGELSRFIDPIITSQLEKEHIPGAVLVLVQDGRILYQRGYGFADLGAMKPVDPAKTIWRIGSISKVFTATAVVQLADRSRFRLADDVNQYMTRFKVPQTYAEPVRFWHLLTHTAGFDEIRPGTRADTEAGLLSLGDFLAPKLIRLRPPGRIISYSTYGISLAGYLVEQVSGLDFETYLRRNIWGPLGMSRTNIKVPDSLKRDLAVGYEWENEQNRLASWEWYHSTPASSINASGTDMARFIIAHLNDGRLGSARILSGAAARDMRRRHFGMHAELPGFAYGFQEDDTNGQRILQHGGNVEGFSAQLTMLPDYNLGFFIASQHEPARLKDVVQKALLDRYFPDQRKRIPPKPMASYLSRAPRYAGTYELNQFCHSCGADRREYPRLEVRNFPDGTISITGNAAHFVEVEPLFFRSVDGSPGAAVFHQDESGRIDLIAGNSWIVFERIK